MELDRPILKREKFELIFLEKAGKIDNIHKITDESLSSSSAKSIESPFKNDRIEGDSVRKAMVDRMRSRKSNNQVQLKALNNTMEYIKTRFQDEKLNPSKMDIQIIEVLKKIVESGWII